MKKELNIIDKHAGNPVITQSMKETWCFWLCNDILIGYQSYLRPCSPGFSREQQFSHQTQIKYLYTRSISIQ